MCVFVCVFLLIFISIISHRDMLPLPYATKENYKVILYRLADCDPEKVSVSASALFDCRFFPPSFILHFSKSLLYSYHHTVVSHSMHKLMNSLNICLTETRRNA